MSSVEWQNGALHRVAQTTQFHRGAFLHVAPEGRLLETIIGGPFVLYTPDLTSFRIIDRNLLPEWISPSGNALGEWTPGARNHWANGSWTIYQVSDGFPILNHGNGELRAVGDETVASQDGGLLNITKLDGARVSSFPLPRYDSRGYYDRVAALPGGKFYLDRCGLRALGTVRIVSNDGRDVQKLTLERGCSWGEMTASTDGSLLMFDFDGHEVHGPRKVLEEARAVATAGMAGAEDVNREKVRIIEVRTGNVCFAWQRSFPSTLSQQRSAALSPSGRFVAIVEEKSLSVYQVPSDCQASPATRK